MRKKLIAAVLMVGMMGGVNINAAAAEESSAKVPRRVSGIHKYQAKYELLGCVKRYGI